MGEGGPPGRVSCALALCARAVDRLKPRTGMEFIARSLRHRAPGEGTEPHSRGPVPY